MTESTEASSSLPPFHYANIPITRTPQDYHGDSRLTISLDDANMTGAEHKRHVAAWLAALPTLPVRELCIWSHVTQSAFDAVCDMPPLERLRIKWSSIRKLDSIGKLRELRFLTMGSSTKVESLDPLLALPQLQCLDIENFKLISDFSPLATLTNLEALGITGSMWTRQPIDSFEPIARMTWLKALAISARKTDSLRPLAALQQLEWLFLDGRQPMEEYAWLAGKLPHTTCRRFHPYTDADWMLCPQCRQRRMVMLTGKGTKMVCLDCDAAKVAKHVEAFEAIRAEAAASN